MAPPSCNSDESSSYKESDIDHQFIPFSPLKKKEGKLIRAGLHHLDCMQAVMRVLSTDCNFKIIAYALWNYYDLYGDLPPAGELTRHVHKMIETWEIEKPDNPDIEFENADDDFMEERRLEHMRKTIKLRDVLRMIRDEPLLFDKVKIAAALCKKDVQHHHLQCCLLESNCTNCYSASMVNHN